MMMYQQTRFSWKRISSSEIIVESHILIVMILHCDLDLEDNKLIFLEDDLVYNDALPYQVW